MLLMLLSLGTFQFISQSRRIPYLCLKGKHQRKVKLKNIFQALKVTVIYLATYIYIASTFRGGGTWLLPTLKSDLLALLEGEVSEPPSHFDVKLLDGSAAVHFLSCNNVSTFAEYSQNVFNIT